MPGSAVVWARRGVLAAALVAVAIAPSPDAGLGPAPCAARHCRTAASTGRLRWVAALPGRWVVRSGFAGTVPASGQAYAAVRDGIVAVGAGLTVAGYRARTGGSLWRVHLSGFGSGASVVSVRAWRAVVTVGVGDGPGGQSRTEVVLAGATGRVLRRYPAAPFGGAAAATRAATVIIGTAAVTCYDNATGAVRWRRPIGRSAQTWQTDGRYLYIAVAGGGYLGTQPVTALRRIDMDTGAERVVRLTGHRYPGTLGAAVDGVVLLAAARGVAAYDGVTGRTLWSRPGAVPAGTDPTSDRFYLTEGTTLLGVDPLTGRVTSRTSGSAAGGSAGMYAVRSGVAFGLDQGPDGEAWGYDLTAQRVTWATPTLPWPHYFTDIGGLGGSADPDGPEVVLAICAKLAATPTVGPSGTSTGGGSPGSTDAPGASAPGTNAAAGSATASSLATPSPGQPGGATSAAQPCARPELVAIKR